MATRTAILVRLPRILPILLSMICLLAPAAAQHGGGGGHSSGGHSSGGHSGGGHAGGHFGWLHFGFGKHSAQPAGFGASSTSDPSPDLPSHLRNHTPSRMPSVPRIPPTLLWSPPLFQPHPGGQVSWVSSPMRRHPGFFFNRFPWSSSGCFLNGVTQVCFFEPFLPLLSFSGAFDPYYSGFGFGEDSLDLGDDLNSQGPMQSEMFAIPPTANPADDDTAEGNSSARTGATPGTADRALDKEVFLLVLNNGTSHAVSDYWVADGYLECISPNGTRNHIPLDALDLQSTVIQNAPRGLPFVLRFAPER